MSSQRRQVLNSCKLNGSTTKIFLSESMDTKGPVTYAFFYLFCFVLVFFFRFVSKIVHVVRKTRVTAKQSYWVMSLRYRKAFELAPNLIRNLIEF